MGTGGVTVVPAKVTQSEQDVIMEGYLKLQKQIGMKHTWMKRFVRLTTKSFSLYRTPEVLFRLFVTFYSFFFLTVNIFCEKG